MSYIEAIILGILQGITEPIPVSSSGHLQLAEALFGIKDLSLEYEIYLNFASLIAIIVFYRKLLKKIFTNTFKYAKTKDSIYKEDFHFFKIVFIASIPAGVLGLFAKDFVEKFFTNPKMTGAMLLVTGLFLFIIRKYKGSKDISNVTVVDALVIGLFQSIALIPGISRSGATIVGSMFRGLKRETAFDVSFLMFIPISVGIFAYELTKLEFNGNISKYLVGMVFSGVLTYIMTGVFRNIVVKGKLAYFSVYCLVVGIIALIFM